MLGWSFLPVTPTGTRPNSGWAILDKSDMATRSISPPTPVGFENGEFIWKYDVEHRYGNVIVNVNTICLLNVIRRYIGERHRYKLPALSMNVALNRDELIERFPTAHSNLLMATFLTLRSKRYLLIFIFFLHIACSSPVVIHGNNYTNSCCEIGGHPEEYSNIGVICKVPQS